MATATHHMRNDGTIQNPPNRGIYPAMVAARAGRAMGGFSGLESLEPRQLMVADPVSVAHPTWFANYNTFVIWRKSPANEPVGAGPFRLVEQERGTSLELVAFDKFYKPGYPKLKGIKFVVYADENLRFAALKSGGK